MNYLSNPAAIIHPLSAGGAHRDEHVCLKITMHINNHR